jgi:hypothetical protein
MRKLNRLLNEAIAGLPTSMNPYAPAERANTDMSADTRPAANTDEIPNAGQPASTEQPISSPKQADAMDIPQSNAISAPTNAEENRLGAPKQKATWERLSTPNKKDMSLRRSDGFNLRFREIDSVPGKYMAQLWREKDVLDKGFVMVPQGSNPELHITTMADEMLDGDSKRYDQQPGPLDNDLTDGKGEEITDPGQSPASSSPAPLGSGLPTGEDLSTDEETGENPEGSEGESIELDGDGIEFDEEITEEDLPESNPGPEGEFGKEDLPSL